MYSFFYRLAEIDLCQTNTCLKTDFVTCFGESVITWLFLQAVSCSLSVMGFGESILGLTGLDNPWIAKGVAIGLVVLLLGELL